MVTPPSVRDRRRRVVIAGGGIAAIEAALALREFARAAPPAITLVAPNELLSYPPTAVIEAFGRLTPHTFRLDAICEDLGVERRAERLVAVDAARRVAVTDSGAELAYDDLVIAVGARAREALRGARTFLADAHHEAMSALLGEGQAGTAADVAFVVPPNTGWSLPLYELALTMAQRARELFLDNLRLTLVTPEDVPLAAFRGAASDAVAARLAAAGIAVLTDTYARDYDGRTLQLVPDGERTLQADHVIALPALEGPDIAGLPRDADGFVRVDERGRVPELEGVFAVGDATSFPIKQGGLAAQQADVVAALIAAEAGCEVPEPPSRPLLRAILLTGGEPLYLEAAIAAGASVTSSVSSRCPWSPPHKIAARFLAPYLAAREREREPDGVERATSGPA